MAEVDHYNRGRKKKNAKDCILLKQFNSSFSYLIFMLHTYLDCSAMGGQNSSCGSNYCCLTGIDGEPRAITILCLSTSDNSHTAPITKKHQSPRSSLDLPYPTFSPLFAIGGILNWIICTDSATAKQDLLL